MRTTDTMVHEVRRWKDRLDTLESIPLNPDHQYKDANDVYERLTVYVKGWVEGMFLKYTNQNGELKDVFDREESKETAEWLETVGNCMTKLENNWWEVALKGKKEQDEPLPHIDLSAIEEKKQKETSKDAQDAVLDYFFPAYRALEEKFAKRWWFEWIFNHKQYTAERDALKVMTNLMSSMTGFSKEKFKEEYRRHKLVASEEKVSQANVAEYDLALAREQERLKKYAEDPNYKEEEIKQPGPDSVEEVVYQDVENTLAVFEQRDADEKGFFREICEDMVKLVADNCFLNEAALLKSVPKHLYNTLSEEARKLCEAYDKAKADGTLEENAKELFENATKQMFEKAFKALGATYGVHTELLNTAVSGMPIFDMKSLKAHIVVAQQVTDIVLKGLTPVGMNAHKHEQFAKGNHLWEKTDEVRAFLKENLKDKYDDNKIEWALKSAKNEIGVLHHNAKREVSQVYEIGYQPEVADLKKLSQEGKKIKNLYKMVTPLGKKQERVVNDPKIIAVITANYNKWKAVDEWRNKYVAFDLDKAQAEWKKLDQQLANIHTEYVPNEVEKYMEETLAQQIERQNLKMALNKNANNAQVAPPVQQAPTQVINNPERK